MAQTGSLHVLGVVLIHSEESARMRLPFEVPVGPRIDDIAKVFVQRPSLWAC
jgi:hypothetical protein